ncbi:MAG: glycosyltransferase family 9 protein [Candidatus Krumholzibacteriota bacterium]|nr:glycosyltransferase family 9 protein [Candidatus Krumholzibacteriota bacterium]
MKGLPDLSQFEHIRNILIIRYFAVGDIALSLPVIYELRKNFPDAKISYLVWERYADTLKGVDELDKVIVLKDGIAEWLKMIGKIRKEKYDLLLDLVSSPGSAQLGWLSGARERVGMDTGRHNWCFHHLLPRSFHDGGKIIRYYTLDTNRELMRMMLPESAGSAHRWSKRSNDEELEIGFPASNLEEGWANGFFAGLPVSRGGYVGITASSNYLSKSWPVERLSELANRMHEEFDVIPVIIWGPGEEEAAGWLYDSVKTAVKPPLINIPRLGALIKKLKLLVGIDSGPKHLAVLQGVPTVTLFGPTDPMVWDPVTPKHRVVFKDLDCFPCKDRNCQKNMCMLDIQVDDLLVEIRKII